MKIPTLAKELTPNLKANNSSDLMPVNQSPDIALFLRWMRDGGAERVIANLANGFAQKGLNVDLVLIQAEGNFLKSLHPNIRVINLDVESAEVSWSWRLPTSFQSTGSLLKLVKYLKRERPPVLLSATHYINEVAILAKRMANVPTRVIVSEHTHLSVEAQQVEQMSAKLAPWTARFLYPWADGIVAVSEGVASNLRQLTGLKPDAIQVIYNPVISAETYQQAQLEVSHPWFLDKEVPIVLGAGRFVRQKDFPTLIRAFAQVRQQRPARLVILGNGRDRDKLESLVNELNIAEHVWMPGFMENPYAYLEKADVFVLSSIWEGLPTVLVEAIALKTPVVSTNCPSGPAEILKGGDYGILTSSGDVSLMAAGILEALENGRRSVPENWIQQFTLNEASKRYASLLDIRPGTVS
jgi:glycosyltransferase involved in cell wall biosynthesis